jgi:cell filamentation protein
LLSGHDGSPQQADVRDQAELDELELALFLIRADEALPGGVLDYEHYKAIHYHLFQDIYEWAGRARSVRIGKGGNWFCYPEYIDREMDRIFAMLAASGHLVGMSAGDFAIGAAHIIGEVNAVHPFREGNGRTQLTLLTILAENAGFPFNDDVLDHDRVIDAMIRSFAGDETPLVGLIRNIVAR